MVVIDSLHNDKPVRMSIEEVLTHIGEYGRYQKLLNTLLFLMCLPMAYPIVFMYFSSFEPTWRCTRAGKTCNFTGIFENTDRRKCYMNRTDWEYTEARTYSFITQYDIGCDEKWKVDLTRSISFAGWAVGAVVLGYLGDKYGRKAVLLPSIIATLIISLVTPFLPNIYLLIFFRFFACFFIPGSTLSSFILVTEVVGPSYLGWAGIMIYATVPTGFCLIVLKAYLIREWGMLGMACSISYLPILVFYPFIPESLQWLSVQGRVDDVIQVLRNISRWNKKEIPSQLIVVLPKTAASNGKTSFIDLFRTRSLTLCSLIGGYIWLIIGMGYYGLLMAADDLGGSLYWDFFIMSFTDLISSFNSVYLCRKFGPGVSTLVAQLFGGLICILVAFIPKQGSLTVIRITCGMIGKYLITIAYYTVYLWSVEFYETSIRAKGMGWMQVCTRIGSTLAPWISDWTSPLGKGGPFIAMGLPVIVGVAMGLKLPRQKLAVLT